MPLRLELMRWAEEDKGEDGGVAGAPGTYDKEGAIEKERKRERERKVLCSNTSELCYTTEVHPMNSYWGCGKVFIKVQIKEAPTLNKPPNHTATVGTV